MPLSSAFRGESILAEGPVFAASTTSSAPSSDPRARIRKPPRAVPRSRDTLRMGGAKMRQKGLASRCRRTRLVARAERGRSRRVLWPRGARRLCPAPNPLRPPRGWCDNCSSTRVYWRFPDPSRVPGPRRRPYEARAPLLSRTLAARSRGNTSEDAGVLPCSGTCATARTPPPRPGGIRGSGPAGGSRRFLRRGDSSSANVAEQQYRSLQGARPVAVEAVEDVDNSGRREGGPTPECGHPRRRPM
jgi:hypothetical protein